ncbi:MAG: DUF2452 domain-containing protein [Vicingaceae bacterium]|nr:DUF2452 domain-containing protein [Vicingaceae bacterium]
MIFTQQKIENWDKVFRLKMINSITGYKGVNLIGTQSNEGILNLGLFSSVFHISSNPALIGIMIRPHTVPRHTLENIRLTKEFTINQVQAKFVKQAHFASANWDKEESEFDQCNFKAEFVDGISAPFVSECDLKFACRLEEELHLKSYNSILLVGSIIYGDVSDECINDDGQLDLEKINSVCVTGLNQYSFPKKLKYLPYARVEDTPNFGQKSRPDNIAFNDETQQYNGHSLPYSSNISAPKITTGSVSNWQNSSISKFNHVFSDKVEGIKKQYSELIEEFETNDLLYKTKMNFEPIIGEVYHLYSDGSEKGSFLSIIPPANWDKEFLGSYKLSHDKVWQKLE